MAKDDCVTLQLEGTATGAKPASLQLQRALFF
jgi:hypothetical protein